MMRPVFVFAALSLCLAPPAAAQTRVAAPAAGSAVASPDEPVPRAARAKARQDCLAENVALSGEDLRPAMRDCIQAKFPGVQLYARDGLTRDGKPTAATARAACKAETDERGLTGGARTAALIACFNARRPDLAALAECRNESRAQGLDGEALRQAVSICARGRQS